MATNGDLKVKNALRMYLTQKGYSETANTLLSEEGSSAGANPRKKQKLSIDFDVLNRSFKQLLDWSISSLDCFKQEFKPILWFVFFHTYIELLTHRNAVVAKQFFDEHNSLFQFSSQQELQLLSAISSKAKLNALKRSNSRFNLLNSYLLNRQTMVVSEVGFNLLLSFLFDQGLVSVLTLLNQKTTFYFKKPSLKSHTSEQEIKDLIKTNSAKPTRSMGSNSILPKIGWGVPYKLEMVYSKSQFSKDLFRVNMQHVYPFLFTTDSIGKKIRKAGNKCTDENIEAAALYSNIYAPKTDTDFFIPIHSYLTSALRVSEEEITSTKDNTITIIDKNYQWPSIALCTIYDGEDVICSENSFDCSLVASGSSNGRLTVFETETDKTKKKGEYKTYREDLCGHSGPVYSVSVSRDKRKLLSCSADGYVRLWANLENSFVEDVEDTIPNGVSQSKSTYRQNDTKRWWNVQAFKPDRFTSVVPIWDVSFCPLGFYFSSAARDCVRLYSVEHEKEFTVLESHESDVNCTSFHPNMHYVFSGGEDKLINMWDLRSHKPARILQGHLQGVRYVSSDASGRYLLSCGDDNLFVVWDLANGKIIKAYYSGQLGVQGSVTSACCSPSGENVAFTSSDGRVTVIDTKYIWGSLSSTGPDFDLVETGFEVVTKDSVDEIETDLEHFRQFKPKLSNLCNISFFNQRTIFAIGTV